MKFLAGLAAGILVLTIPASAQTADPKMTQAERAEHIVLAEALLFETATTSLTAASDEKWEDTLRKTDVLRRALPNRSTKVDAPAAIKPRQAMTRQQLMARFKEQRARALAYVQETEAPLKA